MKHITTLLLAFALTTSAFAQTSNRVVISFSHKAGAVPMVLNETEFTIWNGKKVKLSRADFYLSEMEIHQQNGSTVPLTDHYMLVRADTPNTEFDLGEWPVDAANGMTLHLGVPKAVNHNDPASWPASHPLAPKNPSMHWGWAAGYIFLAVNGKVDNDNDGIPEAYFEYHNVGDTLYRAVELAGIAEAENGVLDLHFTIDYAQLFKNLVLDPFLYVHGGGALNITMLNNVATQNFLSMPTASATLAVKENSLRVQAAPNPANAGTWVSYDLPASAPLQLMLTNVLGQTVRTSTGLPPSGTTRLETATLPEGMYQYAFYENGQLLARKKLIVRH